MKAHGGKTELPMEENEGHEHVRGSEPCVHEFTHDETSMEQRIHLTIGVREAKRGRSSCWIVGMAQRDPGKAPPRAF